MPSRLLKILSSSLMMSGSDTELLEQLLDTGRLRTLKGNTTRIDQGELAQRLFFVVSGEMRMLRMTPDGQEHLLHRFKAGEFFCLAAVISGRTCQSVMVNAGQTELLSWSHKAFRNLMLAHPILHQNVLQQLAEQIENERQMRMLSRCCTVDIKLAAYLLHKINQTCHNKECVCAIDLKPISLTAQELGVARETVSRCIQRMIRLEGLSYHQGVLQVEDSSHLERILCQAATHCSKE